MGPVQAATGAHFITVAKQAGRRTIQCVSARWRILALLLRFQGVPKEPLAVTDGQTGQPETETVPQRAELLLAEELDPRGGDVELFCGCCLQKWLRFPEEPGEERARMESVEFPSPGLLFSCMGFGRCCAEQEPTHDEPEESKHLAHHFLSGKSASITTPSVSGAENSGVAVHRRDRGMKDRCQPCGITSNYLYHIDFSPNALPERETEASALMSEYAP